MADNHRSTVCPHDCPSACALEVECLGDNRIGRIRGARENSYTQGVVCAKVAAYAERVHHPNRLTTPMRRSGPRGSGQFESISWEQALDEVAERFQEITQTYGSEAIWPYYYAGTMGQMQRDGIHRLRHCLGYSGQLKTICTSIAYAGWCAGTGAQWGSDAREIEESDLVIVWGGNPVSTQVNLMTHISRARKESSARLVVIDPYRTETARQADLHLLIRPGTDAALACALMHELFRTNRVDRAYLERHTRDWERLQAQVADKTPEWAEAITGIPADQIRELAGLYGATQRSFIRLGIGFSRQRNGAVSVHAVSCLPALTGAWQVRGGGALLGSSGLFHLDKSLIEGTQRKRSEIRDLDMSRIGPVLLGEADALNGGGPVHGLFIQNCNPMTVAPDLGKVQRGFARKDLFICVHEQFMTETAQMADILLPATTFLEHNDIYQSYGQSFLQAGPRILEPLGACRSNHWVLNELGQRLAPGDELFDYSEEAMLDETLRLSGYPGWEALCQMRWLDAAKPFEQSHFLEGFGWPDGKFRFAPEWSRTPDLPAPPELPDHWPVNEPTTEATPFRLFTPPAKEFLNTTFTETERSRRRQKRPTLLIHPDSAIRLGIGEGELAAIGNQRGEIRLHCRHFEGLLPDCVAVEGIWPADAFPDGQSINLLVGSDRVFPDGGATFHDIAVWVRAAD